MEDTTTLQLQRIAAGEADILELDRLHHAARSVRELITLFGWLRQARAHLVARDVKLDTRTAQGRQMVALLEEVARWERTPARPRGRPGLATRNPDLAERIASLRERGFSLSAIAAVLNRESIPTPRGGAQWRPSSVQAALGYRRPAPPPPGMPPPPGPAGRTRPPAPKRKHKPRRKPPPR